VLVTALTFAALLVHGYHPYAEDGGVYMPEIKRLADPALYPYGTGFVVGHLHYSIFAPMIADLARLAHLRVETVLFGVYLASFWMTLFATSLLASRCYRSREARWGAVTLLAVWMTLPIAGTSLMLMDPYVTARSISTPCALLALVGALDFLLPFANRSPETNPEINPDTNTNTEQQVRGMLLCFVSLAIASAMHPLMGAYAVGSVLLLGILMWPNRIVQVWGMLGLSLAVLATAVGVLLSAPPESATFTHVVLTRYYWFIAQWLWYELIGVIAPLLILAFVALRPRRQGDAARIGLARMAFAAGLLATLVAVFFARAGMQTHAVARLQPLRIFQLVYVIMILVLGATLAERVLQQKAWRWGVLFSLLASIMLSADRMTFPASPHIEYASKTMQRGSTVPGNPWEQAFVWISRNTPRDAVFAMNAHYITQPGEDAQGFRAIAERSALPDFSQDGGVVTNKPELAATWQKGQQAQAGLDAEPDASRVAALKPLGVTWVVLERGDATRFACEYANAAVKVCRLP
jgi:hypothetical protein